MGGPHPSSRVSSPPHQPTRSLPRRRVGPTEDNSIGNCRITLLLFWRIFALEAAFCLLSRVVGNARLIILHGRRTMAEAVVPHLLCKRCRRRGGWGPGMGSGAEFSLARVWRRMDRSQRKVHLRSCSFSLGCRLRRAASDGSARKGK